MKDNHWNDFVIEKYSSRLTSLQPELAHLKEAKSDAALWQDLFKLMIRCCSIQPLKSRFSIEEPKDVILEEMGSNPASLRFLELLISIKQPKKILEVGTFIGSSAMSFADRAGAKAKVFTLEKWNVAAELARKNIAANNLADRITVIEGDGLKTWDEVIKNGPYDFVFLDGNKEHYLSYFQKIDPLLEVGGLVIVDDVFFHGDALKAKPETEKGAGTRAFLESIPDYPNYLSSVVPLGNGIALLVKQA